MSKKDKTCELCGDDFAGPGELCPECVRCNSSTEQTHPAITMRRLLSLGAKAEVSRTPARHRARAIARGMALFEITVEAPPGTVWAGEDLHELVTEGNSMEDLWLDIDQRTAAGVEPCTEADCDWCNPEAEAAQ